VPSKQLTVVPAATYVFTGVTEGLLFSCKRMGCLSAKSTITFGDPSVPGCRSLAFTLSSVGNSPFIDFLNKIIRNSVKESRSKAINILIHKKIKRKHTSSIVTPANAAHRSGVKRSGKLGALGQPSGWSANAIYSALQIEE
jgi:hypothetical protein